MTLFQERQIVSISYIDLVAGSSTDSRSLLMGKIEDAFGEAGLGIIAIVDVPDFELLKSRLLPLSRRLAALSTKELDQITSPESLYQVGWSYGKEKLDGGAFDTSKGSFYANPLTDNLYKAIKNRDSHIDDEFVLNELEETAKTYPAFFAPNVWPSSSIPEFEQTFKEMGLLIHRVGLMIARLCDVYVSSQCEGYNVSLEKILTKSRAYNSAIGVAGKFRKLLAFRLEEGYRIRSSSMKYRHNDHGSLTGLVPAIYLNKEGTIVDCPDKDAGLYIKSRKGHLVHATFPKGSLAFQVGETTQIFTGGILKATPHAVRGCHSNCDQYITRESFALFMEPEFHDTLQIPTGMKMTDAQSADEEKFLPTTVRPLRLRWKPGMNFGQFSEATFAAFY